MKKTNIEATKKIASIFFAVSFLASTVNAKSPEEICDIAFSKKTDETFNKCLEVLENAGGDSQYFIADMYSLGVYPPFKRDKDGLISNLNTPDPKRRVYWLIKAANNKIPSVAAAYQLGENYLHGRSDLGFYIDYSQSIYYFKIASKLGSFVASSELGSIYLKGKGVKKDLLKAYVFDNIALSQSGNDIKYANILREEISEIEEKIDLNTLNQAQKKTRDCLASNLTKCDIY